MTVPRALQRLQRTITTTFTATAVVERKTLADDEAGGSTTTWNDVYTYPCSFSETQISSVERENTVTVQSLMYWRFVFAAGTDIMAADRLRVGSRRFEVVGAGEGSVNIVRRVLCLEIQ